MKNTLAVLFLSFFISSAFAQNKLDGNIQDADDQSPLTGATVKLVTVADSTKWQGAATDLTGKFEFNNVPKGLYQLQINYIGYKFTEQKVFMRGEDKDIGVISMAKGSTTLKDVNIVDNAVRVQMKNDTFEYNANSFKTNKDGTVEDLVTKMPGVTNENGTISAHGEQIKKVLIDGKEYFGDDAQTAMKNVPSDIVDKVQIFDQMSDQSFFTGFDDGNSQKAMNIITRNGMNNGVFGKFYAGYGYLTDSRYSAGASVNYFDGNRRLSLIGMSNNVNLQNFSTQDLLGVTGTTQRGGGHGGGGGGHYGNSALNSFMVGQTGGISTTHSVGLNYSDVLGKKKNFKITGSYFFNMSDNVNETDLNRQYFNSGDSSTYYKEVNASTNNNMNHRVNLRMEYRVDSMNNLIFTPKFSYQGNTQTNNIDGQNSLAEGGLISSTLSNYTAKNSGYNASGDLLYQHKFNKKFRTLSIDVGTTINNKKGNTSQNAQNSFQNVGDSTTIDQQANSVGTSYKVNGNISYTEPAGRTGIVQLSYEPSYTWNKSDKETFNRDTALHTYSLLDTILSNKFDNDYMTHKATASYRMLISGLNLMVGLSGQYALLTGQSVFPYAYSTNRTFYNLLPIAMLKYTFKDKSSIRIFYRTSTNPPAITQMQSVIDNSNPLLLSTGNPDLKQSYTHFVMMRYGISNKQNAQSFFAFVSANFTQNYVGNSSFIATKDTLLNDLVLLNKGSQLTRPVNLNGNMTVNSFFTYGIPISKIKCNLNLNTGFTYSRTPSLINNSENLSNTYAVKGGFTLGSNISEKIDFTLNYTGTYNIVKNTFQTASNNNYYQHSANLRFNWQFWKGFVFNTGLQNQLYTGVSQGYNQNIFLWNAALGYKFLKDESLDVRVNVNDILNQNNGITRTVTDTYIEDSNSKVLKRNLLLTVTYTLKYRKKPAAH